MITSGLSCDASGRGRVPCGVSWTRHVRTVRGRCASSHVPETAAARVMIDVAIRHRRVVRLLVAAAAPRQCRTLCTIIWNCYQSRCSSYEYMCSVYLMYRVICAVGSVEFFGPEKSIRPSKRVSIIDDVIKQGDSSISTLTSYLLLNNAIIQNLILGIWNGMKRYLFSYFWSIMLKY